MNRRISAVALVFLILFSGLFPVKAATNEGYGEDQTALGQVVDSFEDSGNVSVGVNVIQNSTLEAMELNYTVSSGGIQDLTTWTEIDITNDLEVNNSHVVFTTLRRDSASEIYRNYTATPFEEFEINFTLGIDDIEAGDASTVAAFDAMVIGNSTLINVNRGVNGHCIIAELYQSGSVDDRVRFRLVQLVNGILGFSILDATVYVIPDIFYCSLYRSGTTVGLYVFSDEAHMNQIEHLSNGAAAISPYKYIMAAGGYSSGGDAADHSSGYISLGAPPSGYATAGYFTTTDYLLDPYASGAGLTVLVNTSIPANTDIQFQISNDNISWRDHEGVIGDSEDLLGGFEAIDLRYLNYSGNIYFRGNLSTSDSTITPRFNQIRLITMIGNVSALIIQNVTGAWEYYNLSAIAVVTGTHDSGLLNSTYWIDGDTWNCSEVVGVPGYEVKFNVTGIDPAAISLWLVNYVYYDGSASHEVNVEIWNYTSGAYVEIGEIPDQLGFEWRNYTIWELITPSDFVNSSGVLVGRFYHVDAGNINHDIYFDRISVQAFIPTEAAPAGEVFSFFWVALAIALMIIAILLTTMYYEGEGA